MSSKQVIASFRVSQAVSAYVYREFPFLKILGSRRSWPKNLDQSIIFWRRFGLFDREQYVVKESIYLILAYSRFSLYFVFVLIYPGTI